MKKIFGISILIFIVTKIIIWITCGWLFTWVYSIPPIIWLSPSEMMGGINLFWTVIFGLMISMVFVAVYGLLYKGIPGRKMMKGINYGMIVWLVGAFSGMISMPLYMTISTTVVIYWMIQALVISIVNGVIVGSMYKRK